MSLRPKPRALPDPGFCGNNGYMHSLASYLGVSSARSVAAHRASSTRYSLLTSCTNTDSFNAWTPKRVLPPLPSCSAESAVPVVDVGALTCTSNTEAHRCSARVNTDATASMSPWDKQMHTKENSRAWSLDTTSVHTHAHTRARAHTGDGMQ